MDGEQLIKDAVAAIGVGQQDDYKIVPTKHADSLEAAAAALSKILRGSQLGTAASQYEEKDSAATEAQKVFRKVAQRANCAVFLTTCLSAALLIVPSLVHDAKWLLLPLGCCGILSGALGAMWLFEIRHGNLLEAWMRGRAGAEAERLKYFDLATESVENSESAGIPLPLLQLEYFRRYQLDVQRAYYRKRRQDHKQAADKYLTLGAYAVGLGALATGFGGILAGALDSKWVCLAGLATAASALSAFTSTNEALGQDRRNEELYGIMNDALADLAAKLDEVRAAAAKADRQSLKQFVVAVHEQLCIEHKQWVDASVNTAASLAKLDEALAAAKSKAPESNRPAPTSAGSAESKAGLVSQSLDPRGAHDPQKQVPHRGPRDLPERTQPS
jgi:hypothetical protein